ncbi:hypothetical protein LUU34_01639700 [Aix galericulata]|nr:hypothetical protein LUU34_01639700 [Aix galericulata]
MALSGPPRSCLLLAAALLLPLPGAAPDPAAPALTDAEIEARAGGAADGALGAGRGGLAPRSRGW